MELIPLFAAALVTAALFSWFNHRFIKLPTAIGVLLVALAMSLGLSALHWIGWEVREPAAHLLERLEFQHTLLDGMLAFLLFAGALHVDFPGLVGQKRTIMLLATVGVLVTTFLVGGATWLVFGALGSPFGFGPCLLFGALISPTDPIAVLAILKQAHAPKSLETKIVGESLFNDGIGVVVFLVVLGVVVDTGHGAETSIAGLFLQEVGGGILLGLAGGAIAYLLMRSIEDLHVELLITLALAAGVYALAGALHASGPLAVVVAGLFIGNTEQRWTGDEHVAAGVRLFWEIIDDILNTVLFLLIGLEVLVLEWELHLLVAGLIAVPLVLLARFVSVAGTLGALRRFRSFTPGAVRIMTWAGLRGGISVALALSIPASVPARGALLAITYVVVLFSILGQGLTVGPLVRRLALVPASESADGLPR